MAKRKWHQIEYFTRTLLAELVASTGKLFALYALHRVSCVAAALLEIAPILRQLIRDHSQELIRYNDINKYLTGIEGKYIIMHD